MLLPKCGVSFRSFFPTVCVERIDEELRVRADILDRFSPAAEANDQVLEATDELRHEISSTVAGVKDFVAERTHEFPVQ